MAALLDIVRSDSLDAVEPTDDALDKGSVLDPPVAVAAARDPGTEALGSVLERAGSLAHLSSLNNIDD